jgi:hypothetical protein
LIVTTRSRHFVRSSALLIQSFCQLLVSLSQKILFIEPRNSQHPRPDCGHLRGKTTTHHPFTL